tara:strand:- start:1461 stop:1943 length:483 start_codon:yes stop_codon:yes gene_type:complete
MTENGLWYVTNFLTMHDMFRLTSTCQIVNNDKDIWMYFCFYYKNRLKENDKNHFNKLKLVLYGNDKKTLLAHYIMKLWSKMSIPEQLECFSNRKVIILFCIALMLKRGKSILYKYNRHVKSINTISRWDRTNKMRWMCSTWEILKGSKNNIFRRKYLPVY